MAEVGDGPAVLLLHGNPTWSFLYRKVAAALSGDRFRLVMPDLIGLGFSDRPRSASEHTRARPGRVSARRASTASRGSPCCMAPDGRAGHPSLPALERVQSFVTSFPGPVAVVWGDRDPVLGRVRKRIEALLPEATVTRTEAGHFLQEEGAGGRAGGDRHGDPPRGTRPFPSGGEGRVRGVLYT